jgi:hypothetical protein
MAIPAEDRARHQRFAAEAAKELEAHWQEWTAKDVALWWDKWCQFGKATHDGLGRVLLRVTGVKKSTGIEIDFDPFAD